jgi:transposase
LAKKADAKTRRVSARSLSIRSVCALEVDESCFGGARKGKRGRGAAGKVPVFGLLKRGGKVHAVMSQNAKSLTLMGIMRGRIRPDSIVYTDSFRSCDVLDVSEFHHHRIKHSELFADASNHINAIENFWNQPKRHLRRYDGIPKSHFHLFLKECEWRFNDRAASNLLNMLNMLNIRAKV